MINSDDLKCFAYAMFLSLLAAVTLWVAWVFAAPNIWIPAIASTAIFSALAWMYIGRIGSDATIPVIGVVLVRKPTKKQEENAQ